jgi:HPt (histidine-containing phosphotransfer) domain-containing protein
MDAGCTGFLIKPINIDQLMETLAALLGGIRTDHQERAETVMEQAPPMSGLASAGPMPSRLAGNPRLRPAIRKFAARLEEQLVAFEHAFTERDFEQLAQLAHWLRGAAGTVGYDEFTEPAARLEQAARDQAISEIEFLIAELRDLAKRLEIPTEDHVGTVAS